MRQWLPRETEATTTSQTAEIGSMAIAADLQVGLIGIAQGCGIAAGDHERPRFHRLVAVRTGNQTGSKQKFFTGDRPHFFENEDFMRRFRRAAHAAARSNSPHVTPIHRYFEVERRLYVDMRLIEGRDLQTVQTDAPLAALTRERQTSLIKGVACAPSDKTGETR